MSKVIALIVEDEFADRVREFVQFGLGRAAS